MTLAIDFIVFFFSLFYTSKVANDQSSTINDPHSSEKLKKYTKRNIDKTDERNSNVSIQQNNENRTIRKSVHFACTVTSENNTQRVDNEIQNIHISTHVKANEVEINKYNSQESGCDNKDESSNEENTVHKPKIKSVVESIGIIDEYKGNGDIMDLKNKYLKQYQKNHPMQYLLYKKTKSTHSVVKSRKIIAQYRNSVLRNLKKKYKNEIQVTKQNTSNETKHIKKKSTHSVCRSNKIIKDYKGNNDIAILKRKYLKQAGMKNSENKSEIKIPPKPKDINRFMTCKINILHNKVCDFITANMKYVGMVEFDESNQEMCLELQFTSNIDGVIKGNRVLVHNANKLIVGNGKITKDILWNDNEKKYEAYIKFEWVDKYKNIITKLIFDTKHKEFDIEHLYFEGNCYQYICDESVEFEMDEMNMKNIESMTGIKVLKKGIFNIVCVSIRKRYLSTRDHLCNYHDIDIWDMSEDELQSVPKYIKCMNITPVKMHQVYTNTFSGCEEFISGF